MGGLWPEKTLPEPGARGPGSERGGLAPPAGLHCTVGPVGRAGGGGGPCCCCCCWWRGGCEEGSGPSLSSAGPRPGVLFPLGGGTVPAPSVCQSGHIGSCWPAPPSESRKCLEVWTGLWSGGGWGPGSRRGLTPALLPPRPLGEFLSRQLLLQVPVFRGPCSAGVGGPQGGPWPWPSVFLRLRRLLFHLHLVAGTEGIVWAPWWPSPAPLENSSRILGHRGVPTTPPQGPYHP